ncbi:MGDG synthase family glycosyltransferase [Thermicanus aegyptius]|uniref:MGDG synthase family glycosyltransferase n=1 Tax=Thermicanus aegyptius TaxID=94009 RepID=UPI00042809CF|nr:glycosyltransferase [Thermicanus aegyptius]
MAKVLYLPLLTIPSGHERVADVMERWITAALPGVQGKKVELLSHTHPKIGEWVTSAYLRWISLSPKTYGWLYRRMAERPKRMKSFLPYERLFREKLYEIFLQEKPDLVIATHAFPSLLLSHLKRNGRISVPAVNVYTDYYVNHVWGREGIDLHFLPTEEERKKLIREGIDPGKLFVTGIPVDPIFLRPSERRIGGKKCPVILLAGGSVGLGINELPGGKGEELGAEIHVLCGQNEQVWRELSRLGHPQIIPHRYIDSREEMNALYDRADAIITKPGGATVSEALQKGLPLFLHTSLPAQEERNFQILVRKGLAIPLMKNKPFLPQILAFLKDERRLTAWERSRNRYVHSLEWEKGRAFLLQWIQEV